MVQILFFCMLIFASEKHHFKFCLKIFLKSIYCALAVILSSWTRLSQLGLLMKIRNSLISSPAWTGGAFLKQSACFFLKHDSKWFPHCLKWTCIRFQVKPSKHFLQNMLICSLLSYSINFLKMPPREFSANPFLRYI